MPDVAGVQKETKVFDPGGKGEFAIARGEIVGALDNVGNFGDNVGAVITASADGPGTTRFTARPQGWGYKRRLP